MPFETIAEGFVHRCDPRDSSEKAIAVCARCALTATGEMVCAYVLQTSLDSNDCAMFLSRSVNGAKTWSTPEGPLLPSFSGKYGYYFNVSLTRSGQLFGFGQRRRGATVKSMWSPESGGLKPGELFWTRSEDNGRTWNEPVVIPKPFAGSIEVPGPMCFTRTGRWVGVYSPYPTLDPNEKVDRNQVVCLSSDDHGRTWTWNSMLRFPEEKSGGAEAWVVELADGRLLGAAWHINESGDGRNFANAFAVSHDYGKTWGPTCSTGIRAHTSALTPLADGRALFVYAQRVYDPKGIHIAVCQPTDAQFNVESDQLVWGAESVTQTGEPATHDNWKNLSFGEPSVLALPDQTYLLTYWRIQPGGTGICYVKLQATD